MALERRLLLPVAIVFLLTFLFLSSSRTNSVDSTLYDVEGLIPYEQEYEHAGALTPYVAPVKGESREETEDGSPTLPPPSEYEGSFPPTKTVDEEELPDLDAISLPVVVQKKPKVQKSSNKNAIVISLSTTEWMAPATPPSTGRYLSYVAHSGFHNQRISFVNALTLAQLLDRTLLVPPATLGRAVDWAPTPLLQQHVEEAENADIHECKTIKDKVLRKQKCGNFWNSRRVSWSWLLDAKALFTLQRGLIDRPSHDKSWYWETLSIKNSDIKTYDDFDRRSYRFFENINMPDLPAGPDGYTDRINIDELKSSTDGYGLLEFGSLYGSSRLILENTEKKQELEKLMSFKQPILEKISEAVVERLGGRSNFVGAHLRVGDKFDIESKERMAGVFQKLVKDGFGLDDRTVTTLLAKNGYDPTNPSGKPQTLEKPLLNSKTFYPTPNLACPSVLYDSNSPLSALNVPLYIATDSMTPATDPVLDFFRNTFPCIFFLSDFSSISNKNLVALPEMVSLGNYVDEFAEPLGKFLAPFIDAEIAAKARTVTGTPGSTFSGYVKTTLYDSYRVGTSEELRPFVSKGSFGVDAAVEVVKVAKPADIVVKPLGKGKDREEMLAAEKEKVKKPVALDDDDDEIVDQKKMPVVKKPIVKQPKVTEEEKVELQAEGALELAQEDKYDEKAGSKPLAKGTTKQKAEGALELAQEEKYVEKVEEVPAKIPSKTLKEDVAVLPDQIEEEMEGELELASKDKYLDEDGVKAKMKADKLASEKKVLVGELPKALEKEMEKSSEGKFTDEFIPFVPATVPVVEGPLDLGGEVELELKEAEEEKFSDKVVPIEKPKTSQEEIKEASKELKQATEDKYSDEEVVDVTPSVEEVKGKNRLSHSDEVKLEVEEDRLEKLLASTVIREGDDEE